MAYQQHAYYQQPTPETAESPQHQQHYAGNLYHQPSVQYHTTSPIQHQRSVHYPQQPPSIHRQDSVAHPTWQSTTSSHPETMSSSMSSAPPKTPMSEFGGTAVSDFGRTAHSYPSSRGALYAQRPRKEERRIWGLKRQTFFILLAVFFFLVVIAVATGLGVGLALSNNSSSSSTAAGAGAANSTSSIPTSTSSPTGMTTTSTSSTPLATLPSPTPNLPLAEAPIICPDANNTDYISSTNRMFEIQCGRDYNQNAGAADITSISSVTSMAACLDLCAARSDCVGVGYGDFQGTWTCWPKSKLGTPNWSAKWYAAVLKNAGTGN